MRLHFQQNYNFFLFYLKCFVFLRNDKKIIELYVLPLSLPGHRFEAIIFFLFGFFLFACLICNIFSRPFFQSNFIYFYDLSVSSKQDNFVLLYYSLSVYELDWKLCDSQSSSCYYALPYRTKKVSDKSDGLFLR